MSQTRNNSSQVKGVSITAIVNEIDEGVLDAVRVLKLAIKDEKAKVSERTTAANSLLKIKTQMFGMQRQQVYDRIDLKMKQINLRTAELKLLAMETVSNPASSPEQVKAHSRVLTPDMKPFGIDDKVSKEGL